MMKQQFELTRIDKTFAISCIANAQECDDISKMQIFRTPWGTPRSRKFTPPDITFMLRETIDKLSRSIVFGEYETDDTPEGYPFRAMSGFVEQMGRRPTLEDANNGWHLGYAPGRLFLARAIDYANGIDGCVENARSWELLCECGLFKD